jgi:hypothetical protein
MPGDRFFGRGRRDLVERVIALDPPVGPAERGREGSGISLSLRACQWSRRRKMTKPFFSMN